MSYCRWSSDGFRSAVYCYESVGGFETHVAARQPDIPEGIHPPPVSLINTDRDEWTRLHEEWNARLAAATYTPIGLPCDGQSFCDDTEVEMFDRLRDLAKMGYHVPQYLLDET